MIEIIIGESKRYYEDLDENWINQQINRRKKDGIDVCIKVIIEKDDINMILSTPNCIKPKGDSRPARSHEKIIFDLWNKCGLDDSRFSAGNLIAFLKQLRKNI